MNKLSAWCFIYTYFSKHYSDINADNGNDKKFDVCFMSRT